MLLIVLWELMMKGLQIRIEREKGNRQYAGRRFRQLDAGVWGGRGREGAGGMLVSALTNAAPGEVSVGKSEMSCGLLPFLKEGAASVVLVNQKGSKPSHQASLSGNITDPSRRVMINTETQHQTILDTPSPPVTFGRPGSHATGSCFLTAHAAAWLGSSSVAGCWGVQGLLLPWGYTMRYGCWG